MNIHLGLKRKSLKLWSLLFRIIFFPRKKKIVRLCLIRIDGIGDYILFRNFIEEIHSHYTLGSQLKTNLFIGNIAFKSIFDAEDSHFFAEQIWIDPNRLANDYFYQLRILYQLTVYDVDYLINPTLHHFRFEDIFAFHILASNKISGVIKGEKIPQNVYSKVYEIDFIDKFEFLRTKKLVSKILYKDSKVDYPLLLKNNKMYMSSRIVSIAPSSGSGYRSYPIKKFELIVDFLLSKEVFDEIIIIGGNNDKELGDKLAKLSPKVRNLCGVLSLSDTVDCILNSKFLIGNDTGIVHIAAATLTPTICIVGGGHINRFFPYPHSINHPTAPIVLNEKWDCDGCNWNCKFQNFTVYPCIGQIDVNIVIKHIADLILKLT